MVEIFLLETWQTGNNLPNPGYNFSAMQKTVSPAKRLSPSSGSSQEQTAASASLTKTPWRVNCERGASRSVLSAFPTRRVTKAIGVKLKGAIGE